MSEAKALTETIVEIFATGRLDQIEAVVADDYVDHQGLAGREIRGQDGRLLPFRHGRLAELWGAMIDPSRPGRGRGWLGPAFTK
jgi:hypothetical protein